LVALLSIVVLILISTLIVRIAGVVLEHTGVPRHVARFQALSALSAAGFTTSESEELMRHPARRKVMFYLIAAGNLGIASLSATLIVGALSIRTDASAIVGQAATLAAALFAIHWILTSSKLDSAVCSLAHRWLDRQNATARDYIALQKIGRDAMIAEHFINNRQFVAALPADAAGLMVLGARKIGSDEILSVASALPVPDGHTLILFGTEAEHEAFSARFGRRREHTESVLPSGS